MPLNKRAAGPTETVETHTYRYFPTIVEIVVIALVAVTAFVLNVRDPGLSIVQRGLSSLLAVFFAGVAWRAARLRLETCGGNALVYNFLRTVRVDGSDVASVQLNFSFTSVPQVRIIRRDDSVVRVTALTGFSARRSRAHDPKWFFCTTMLDVIRDIDSKIEVPSTATTDKGGMPDAQRRDCPTHPCQEPK
jgi:hypothetical protein